MGHQRGQIIGIGLRVFVCLPFLSGSARTYYKVILPPLNIHDVLRVVEVVEVSLAQEIRADEACVAYESGGHFSPITIANLCSFTSRSNSESQVPSIFVLTILLSQPHLQTAFFFSNEDNPPTQTQCSTCLVVISCV